MAGKKRQLLRIEKPALIHQIWTGFVCSMISTCFKREEINAIQSWLVVSTPLKNISQMGSLFNIWEIKKCSKPPPRKSCRIIHNRSCSMKSEPILSQLVPLHGTYNPPKPRHLSGCHRSFPPFPGWTLDPADRKPFRTHAVPKHHTLWRYLLGGITLKVR